jgi:hypothetical protein
VVFFSALILFQSLFGTWSFLLLTFKVISTTITPKHG